MNTNTFAPPQAEPAVPSQPTMYIAVLITNQTDGSCNFTTMMASRDPQKVQEFADKQKRFAQPNQIVDVFDCEEVI